MATSRNSGCMPSIAKRCVALREAPSTCFETSAATSPALYRLHKCRCTSRAQSRTCERRGEMLLADFHIHTTWSDGKLPMGEVVDLFGRSGHDVIAITDH